jgi:hypothetical protein
VTGTPRVFIAPPPCDLGQAHGQGNDRARPINRHNGHKGHYNGLFKSHYERIASRC